MTEEIIINGGRMAGIKTLRSKLTRLEQENKELKEQLLEDRILDKHIESLSREDIYRSALEEIKRVVKLAHKVEDYLLGQDYTDLVDRIQDKINEVLK